MKLKENSLYIEDVKYVGELSLPFEKLAGKTVVLSGATGLIGSFLIDTLMYRNNKYDDGIKIVALGRSRDRICSRGQTHS